ncbi:MAG: hypothetical protein ACI9NC_002040, partial [Verrucomicrobiales bacterium]
MFRLRPLVAASLLLGVFSTSVRAEQVVISEIMYHPPAGRYEFIEVENLTATPFDIAKWKLRDGANFDFP